jgi:hypothetical protein
MNNKLKIFLITCDMILIAIVSFALWANLNLNPFLTALFLLLAYLWIYQKLTQRPILKDGKIYYPFSR